ncbi:SDR family oxidoreductase [Saccharothrix syringae]|uniref:NAD-dependent epimerase/dehydratase family protein n=1 Tax=Saccharothrix syringae TaxID=103733 RepID=A0A5Q0H0L1_SACSY|nr:NAD(P)H-binding protein [Saccharothrix syringae]QFZ19394.1 NAD-dependent epimerase/dehydratase family protein [Saccharothrix syringae]
MKIAVAGGTGVVGRKVVEAVGAAGHEAVVIGRSTGVDLITGAGLDEALAGCGAVVDVSNAAVWTREEAERFFGTVTTNLLAAAGRAGVRHLVVLSIVGADVVDLDYYFGKRRQEELVAAGDVPWTVLRATQFFEFAGQVLAQASGPVAQVPPMLSQPVSTEDVAARLVELAAGEPRGFVPPIAGPERLRLVDMARQVVARRGDDLRVEELAEGPAGLATGALTPQGEYTEGRRTFADYLDSVRS